MGRSGRTATLQLNSEHPVPQDRPMDMLLVESAAILIIKTIITVALHQEKALDLIEVEAKPILPMHHSS